MGVLPGRDAPSSMYEQQHAGEQESQEQHEQFRGEHDFLTIPINQSYVPILCGKGRA